MATVINNPSDKAENGIGIIAGIVIALAIIILAALYLIPALRGNAGGADSGNNGTIPSGQVDVNLNSGSGAGSTGAGQ